MPGPHDAAPAQAVADLSTGALCLSLQGRALREALTTDWPGPTPVLCLPWAQALQQTVRSHPSLAVWVIEVDAVHGPDVGTLQRAWAGRLPDARVLALLPPALHSQASVWLDAGVDRCLCAPCEPRAVAAMVRALARRGSPPVSELSAWAGLTFDHRAMTLHRDEQRIALTQREAELMSLLMRRIGMIVPSQELLLQLGRGDRPAIRPAMVQLYVHRVNRKIAPHGLHIDCVKRVGYVLRVGGAEAPAQPLWTAWSQPRSAGQVLPPVLS